MNFHSLTIKLAKGKKDFQEILDYSIDAFSAPDFSWNMEALKKRSKRAGSSPRFFIRVRPLLPFSINLVKKGDKKSPLDKKYRD